MGIGRDAALRRPPLSGERTPLVSWFFSGKVRGGGGAIAYTRRACAPQNEPPTSGL